MIETTNRTRIALIVAAGFGVRLLFCTFYSDRISHDADAAMFARAHSTGQTVHEVALELAHLGPDLAAKLLAEWSAKESLDRARSETRNTSVIGTPPIPGSDPFECAIIADNLLHGSGYRGISCFHPEDHVTACRPPLVPVTWAIWSAVLGHRYEVARVADAVYGTVSILLLFLIGRRTFNERVGIIAAVMLAIWPQAILLTGGLMTETLFVMLELAFVWLCIRAGDRPSLARFAAAGACAGLATLTRPNLLPLLPLLPVWSAVVFRRDRRALVKSLAVLVAALAIISPWTYRNYQIFGKFIPVSTLSGINLLYGNNEVALAHPDMMGYLIDEDIGGFERRARGLDESELDEMAVHTGKAWLFGNRDKWAILIWTKLKKFCAPVNYQPCDLARRAMILSWGFVLPLALPALFASLWNFVMSRNAGLMIHMLILSAFISYLVIYVVPRYRFPIEPLFILMASVILGSLLGTERIARQGAAGQCRGGPPCSQKAGEAK
jgi:4-amino-4-deoxy-L-arabinose transferase-like glycosyltransferase